MFDFFKKKEKYNVNYFDTMFALEYSSKLNGFADDAGSCDFFETLDREDRDRLGEFHDVRVEYLLFDKVFIFTYKEWLKILETKVETHLKEHPEDTEKALAYLEEYKKKANIN